MNFRLEVMIISDRLRRRNARALLYNLLQQQDSPSSMASQGLANVSARQLPIGMSSGPRSPVCRSALPDEPRSAPCQKL
jgi:hypothetical protein